MARFEGSVTTAYRTTLPPVQKRGPALRSGLAEPPCTPMRGGLIRLRHIRTHSEITIN